MSEISSNSSSNIIKVSEIGMAFGREYYTVLSREPSRLHLFYAKNSTLLHADEGDLDTPISIGSEAIQNAVNKNSFLGSRFIIGSIDCHPSQNGGILVNVLGQIQKRGQASSSRHFMQTFFLAEQPSGYFILNDNMRFLERPASVSSPSTNATSTVSATEAAPVAAEIAASVSAPAIQTVAAPAAEKVVASVESTPVVTETVAAPAAEVAAPAPTKVKKITTAASKQKSSSSPTSAAAPAVVVETPAPVEEVPAGPSSWAQLAAVQQNKWASGVVSLNKGTSIQSEEKPKATPSAASASTAAAQNRKTPTEQAAPRRTNNNNETSISSSPSKPSKLPFVPEASLYVTGVTNNLKSDAIRAEFAALGALAHFDVKYISNAAFVEYVDPAIAKLLLEEGGIVVDGTRLTVEKRRVVNRNSYGNNASDNSRDKDAAAKKFTPTKSNRRERPANKTATPATAAA